MKDGQKNPKVTVLMLVYNRAHCLSASVESVLNQTFKDFELLIIDDGSTDQSAAVIKRYNDPRIRLLQNGENRGIVYSRNKGISEARGMYIAVLDSDDIALPTRLQEQVGFLDENSDFGMVASWIRVVDFDGNYLNEKNECKAKPGEIPVELLFHNVFAHSSVTFRREILQEFQYSADFPMAEDYELFVRIAEKYKSCLIPKTLVLYRKHSENISGQKKLLMDSCVGRIIGGQLQKLSVNYSDKDLQLHLALGEYRFSSDRYFVETAEKWLKLLRTKNDAIKRYDSEAFNKVIGDYWFHIMYAATAQGFWALNRFHGSELAGLYRINSSLKGMVKYLVFIGRCLIKK